MLWSDLQVAVYAKKRNPSNVLQLKEYFQQGVRDWCAIMQIAAEFFLLKWAMLAFKVGGVITFVESLTSVDVFP